MATSTLHTSNFAQRNLTRYPHPQPISIIILLPPSSSYIFHNLSDRQSNFFYSQLTQSFTNPPNPPVPLRTMHILPIRSRQKHLPPAPTPHRMPQLPLCHERTQPRQPDPARSRQWPSPAFPKHPAQDPQEARPRHHDGWRCAGLPRHQLHGP